MQSLIQPTPEGLIDQFGSGPHNICVYENRQLAEKAAASAVAAEIRRLIAERGRAIGIFGSHPPEAEFLDELARSRGIDWSRVIGFHLGEYLDMNEDSPKSLRRFLIESLVKKVPMAEFHGLRGEAANPAAVCANYQDALRSRPPDFAALELGDDGRLTFDDSAVGDGIAPALVNVVEIDEMFRRQQVAAGAFENQEDVPRRALTLTVPAVMACPRLFVVATGERKQKALRSLIERDEAPPSTILKVHKEAHLFLDRGSAGALRG
jgi:glucosamine-6-phosphate deaminase